MINQYETVFIASPILSETEMKEAVDKFKAVIVNNGGEVINDDYWGLRKLAYPIKNKHTGFYQLFEYKAPTTLVDKLELEFRRDERIMRFLTVKLDKFAVAYNDKRRNKTVETDKK